MKAFDSRVWTTIVLVYAVGLASCGAKGDTRLRARFVLPAASAEAIPVRDLPYPNDAHLGSDGLLAITADTLPFSISADGRVMEQIASALQARRCFGVSSGAVFPLDNATPDDPIDASALTDGNISFVNLASGTRVPIDAHYRTEQAQISVRPVLGYVLDPGATYAVLLTTSLATRGGERLAAAPDLVELLSGKSAHRANAAYKSLRDYLAQQAIDPKTIAGATVFTTCDLSRDFVAVQAQLDALQPKASIIDVIGAGPALDSLLGTPADNTFPGVDNPGGIAHASIAHLVRGTFASPNYQSDTPGLLGRWQYDRAGAPIAKGTDDVPFLLVLPHADHYANTPIVVFQHGINGNRTQVLHVANTLAAHGFATIGIDIPFHGDRFPGAVDSFHNITGAAGADGFADGAGAAAALLFLDLIGDQRVGWIDPDAMVASFQQAAVDMMVLARLIDGGDWSALTQLPQLASLTFNGDRIVFASESFGGIIGASAVAYEPRYGAAFLAVAGGGLLNQLLENSPVYGSVFMPILNGAMDINPSDVDPRTDPAHTHLGYQILGPMLDVGDPATHAHRIVPMGKHVVMVNAFADEAVPNQSSETLASAMGLAWTQLTANTAPPRFAEFDMLSGEVTGNRNGTTAVSVVIQPATHGMMTRRGGTQHYEPTFPPVTSLPDPLEIDSPIVELQRQLSVFARTYVDSGVPTLIDPFTSSSGYRSR